MSELSVFQGDELTFQVDVVDETGATVNLTGAAIAVVLFRGPAGQPEHVRNLLDGVQVITATAPARFLVTYPPALTAALTGKYLVEAKVKFSNGRVETVLRGKLKVAYSALKAMP